MGAFVMNSQLVGFRLLYKYNLNEPRVDRERPAEFE
jgi:hypothetical protein